MFAVEVCAELPGGGWDHRVVRGTRIRVTRIDEDGLQTILTSVSDWTPE